MTMPLTSKAKYLHKSSSAAGRFLKLITQSAKAQSGNSALATPLYLNIILNITLSALLSLGLSNPAHAQKPLHIAVASNFKSTLDLLAQQFTEETRIPILISHGSSGQLFAQIRNGAPYDLFFSADQARPKALEKAGLIHASARKTYALGKLALWVKQRKNTPPPVFPALNPQSNANQYLHQINASGLKPRLSIANPNTAPYGVAAKAFLEKTELWSSLKKNIIRANNVSQVFQHVQSGNSELGLLAVSQLQFAKVDAQQYLPIPPQTHPPINQQVVVLKASPRHGQAMQFYQWLDQQSVRALIQQAGYSVAPL